MLLELLLMLTPIDGTKYNTRALQQANYANIQVRGNGLVGEQKLKPAPLPKLLPGFLPKQPTATPTVLPNTKLNTSAPYYDKTLTGTGLQLTGAMSPEHQKIADKYSPYFKTPIAIQVLKNDKGFADKSMVGKSIGGANNYYQDGSRRIQVDGSVSPEAFELVMLHEIAHQVFHLDEDSAWNYAKQMMSMYGNN